MVMTSTGPGLPGAVEVSRLRVYDWETEDGLHGGSPHMHTASSEGYVVLNGTGEVHTLSLEGYRRTPLEPGEVVWFQPGTIHRLVNGSGNLEILTIMQNAGLPESGDAVFTFPDDVLSSGRYSEHAALPTTDDPAALALAARARRDLALRGFELLLEEVDADRPAALDRFYRHALRIVAPRVEGWRRIWTDGPLAQVTATERALDSITHGDTAYLAQGRIQSASPNPGPDRFGMCGHLTTWPLQSFTSISE
jgi:mannose-6-phosphate isomerase-like protein (cupin superfamily)